MKHFDILIVGHYSYDSIILHKKERKQAGGAVYYCAFPLKQIDCKIGVATKIKKEDESLLSEFTNNGIEVLPTYESSVTTVTEINYPDENMDKREMRVVSFGDPFVCERDIPQNVTADWVHLGALYKGEMNLKFIQEMHKRFPNKLSIDVQGFIRKVNEKSEIEFVRDWKERVDVLKHISILKVDRKEAEMLSDGETDLKKALRKIADMSTKENGAMREILCTSTDGVRVYDIQNDTFSHYPFKNKNIIGRTGRGDTTIASYLGFRITRKKSVDESCKYCTAVVSMKMEKAGPFQQSLEDVEEFVKKFY